MVLNNLAWALGKVNDKERHRYRGASSCIGMNSPVVLDTLGMLYLRQRRCRKRRLNISRPSASDQKVPQLHLSLARALIKSGDKAGARKELDEAQQGAPEKAPLRVEIDKLRATL